MTHILIPIADIQAEINENKKYLNSIEPYKRDSSWDRTEIETEFMEDLLAKYKQISLDEKDVEKKSIENSRGYDAQSVAINCYKQALKDLL